jgi:hypothetical protein
MAIRAVGSRNHRAPGAEGPAPRGIKPAAFGSVPRRFVPPAPGITIGRMIWIRAAGHRSYSFGAMDERAEMLRRRIALYRRHLAEGVDAELAWHYLSEIANAESQLAEMGEQNEKRE